MLNVVLIVSRRCNIILQQNVQGKSPTVLVGGVAFPK
jgi:hypothetical protein